MKTTLFDEFLKTNKIKVKELPEPIQDKMGIYNEMHSQLSDTVEEDKKILQKKLEDLEDEIYEDLLNEFESQLTNNEVVEEKPLSLSDNQEKASNQEKSSKPEKSGADSQSHKPQSKELEKAVLDIRGETDESIDEEGPSEKENIPKSEPTSEKDPNEKILDDIYGAGRIDNLSKSYLKSKGLDVDFSQWEISVGKYLLYRKSVFHIRFRLAKK